MYQFIIRANDSWIDTKNNGRTRCLKQDITAFYHSDYCGGGNWKIKGTIENLICTFKNDVTPYTNDILDSAIDTLSHILREDLREIRNELNNKPLRVCVIPRAKADGWYRNDQKLFRETVRSVVNNLNGFEDGTYDIIRHTNTQTTHRARSGYGGDGSLPYCGITAETCKISYNVSGKNILLIDDLYTKTVGIDEDAIQALYNKGANQVFFYSIGKTVR